MPRQSTAWLLVEFIVVLVFGVGAMANLLFWLRASRQPAQRSESTPKHVRSLAILAALSQPRLLGYLFLEIFFQWRLFRVGRTRWLAHCLLFWGNVILFFVGSLGLMLAEKGLLPITKDTPWFAAVNELAGLMVLLGVALSIFRSYHSTEKPATFSGGSLVWLVWMGAVALSGYALEAARLASEQVVPTTAAYSFVGYTLSRTLTAFVPSWSTSYRDLWWIHAGAAMALVASVPYGRLFHMFASPLVILFNRPQSTEASLGGSAPVGIGGEEGIRAHQPS